MRDPRIAFFSGRRVRRAEVDLLAQSVKSFGIERHSPPPHGLFGDAVHQPPSGVLEDFTPREPVVADKQP